MTTSSFMAGGLESWGSGEQLAGGLLDAPADDLGRGVGRAPVEQPAGLGAVVAGPLGPRLPVAEAGAAAVGVADRPLDHPLEHVDNIELPRGRGDLVELGAGAALQGPEVLLRR